MIIQKSMRSLRRRKSCTSRQKTLSEGTWKNFGAGRLCPWIWSRKRGKEEWPVGRLTGLFFFHAVKNLTTAEGGAVVWKPLDGIDSAEIYPHLFQQGMTFFYNRIIACILTRRPQYHSIFFSGKLRKNTFHPLPLKNRLFFLKYFLS